ncbi:MAG: HypC/HybG/HupF family hydrogenase formation chaperone [Bryobacteraceae bacterium]
MCLAIPARIIESSTEQDSRALVEVAGVRRHIDTGLLQEDPPRVGDWVLVHVGFAMSKISEEQALDQLRTLALLGEQDAIIEEVQGYESSELNPSTDASPPAGSSP